MLRLSRGAERQPSFGRRAESIPKRESECLKTQKQNPKKSTNGILCPGTKLWKRTPELGSNLMLWNMYHLLSFRQTTTFRHFTLMDMSKLGEGNTFFGERWSFGNHQIPDDDKIQTQHFGFTLFVIFWFNTETSGWSNPQKVVGHPRDSLYICRPRPFTGSTSLGGPKELIPGD